LCQVGNVARRPIPASAGYGGAGRNAQRIIGYIARDKGTCNACSGADNDPLGVNVAGDGAIDFDGSIEFDVAAVRLIGSDGKWLDRPAFFRAAMILGPPCGQLLVSLRA
jgi:hypothetical protein